MKPILAQGLGANADLRHYPAAQPFTITRRARPAWFLGTVIGLALLTLIGWVQEHDNAARTAERDRHAVHIKAALDRTRCRPPNAPLEILILSIASQADSAGAPLTVTCLYISNDLPIVPKLKREPPVAAHTAAR